MRSQTAGGNPAEPGAALLDELRELVATTAEPADALLVAGARRTASATGDSVIISILSADGQRLHPMGVGDPDPQVVAVLEPLRQQTTSTLAGFSRTALDRSNALLLARTSPELIGIAEPQLADYADRFQPHSLIAAPMRARGTSVGVVMVLRGERTRAELSAADAGIVQAAADLLGLGLGAAHERPQHSSRFTPSPDLSARERQVLTLLAHGRTNREIAGELHLSVRTVEWHRSRIQTKLGVSGRAALTRAALTAIGGIQTDLNATRSYHGGDLDADT